MKRTGLSLCFSLICLWTITAVGQEPVFPAPELQPAPAVAPRTQPPSVRRSSEVPYSTPEISPSASPELWLYQQEMRRYDDPQQAVRRVAEMKGNQRRQRLEAQKWFGVSNSRPMASATPFMDHYSPYWGGNGGTPFIWNGVQTARPAVQVNQYITR